MRAIELIVIGIFAGLISISTASAVCDDYLRMFELSSEKNAHVGLWNSSYTEEICFDDFFNISGFEDEGDFLDKMDVSAGSLRKSNSDGSNIITRIYSESNSHANIPNGTEYPINVSYGDLHCEVRPFGDRCGYHAYNEHPEKRIVSLRSYYNSHVSRKAGPGGYDVQICCASENFESLPDDFGNCGNGDIDGDEDCDGDNLREESCSSLLGVGYVGLLNCAYDCIFDTSGCGMDSSVSDFCIQYGVNEETGGHEIIGEDGLIMIPQSCSNYNGARKPDDYKGSESEFREFMCGCYSLIGESTLGDLLPQDGFSPACGWVEGTCVFEYSSAGGTCIIREVGGSDSGCEPGQLKKTINITDSCRAECGPTTGGCPVQVSCAKVVQLPFFDYKNAIVSLIAIFLVYMIYRYRKK